VICIAIDNGVIHNQTKHNNIVVFKYMLLECEIP